MANRTIAQRIAVYEAQRTSLETSIAAAQSAISSSTQGDMQVTLQKLSALREELATVEKSIQRLYRGGRGIAVDMSYAASESDTDTTS
jgi:hypothetical protein